MYFKLIVFFSWSERRNHLAGSLGQWLLQDLFNRGWANRVADSRVAEFSPAGLKAFAAYYWLPQLTLVV